MAYWRLLYHIVWGTKNGAPVITPEIEPALHGLLAHKGQEQKAIVYAVNGMNDHIHVVASIPPTILLPDFIKNLKGASSRFVHVEFQLPFEWQAGYGIFTISERNLKTAVLYVQNQKSHHLNGTTIGRYEQFDESGNN
jgi:REP element-mobilizing transposase RayT